MVTCTALAPVWLNFTVTNHSTLRDAGQTAIQQIDSYRVSCGYRRRKQKQPGESDGG